MKEKVKRGPFYVCTYRIMLDSMVRKKKIRKSVVTFSRKVDVTKNT